jgi:ubiquinone/menaquinone biosynthesis C-methylase UbiE
MTRESDLKKEIMKYSGVAKRERQVIQDSQSGFFGIDRVPAEHQKPFEDYYEALGNLIRPGTRVLELGAGTGLHSAAVVEFGGNLTALDISRESLDVLSLKLNGKVKTLCADMVSIPLPDNSFEVIISCGSLSYGEPSEVYAEVRRLLKPGGSIVFLDTLNHNWIYSLNRFRHFIQGNRTFSSLRWMPRLKIIKRYQATFEDSSIHYYGKVLWLYGAARILLPSVLVKRILTSVDDSKFFARSAFKFLLVCKNLQK